VHGPVRHGPQIDQQLEPVPSEEKLQIQVLGFVFFFFFDDSEADYGEILSGDDDLFFSA